ncbi:MAG: sigma-70 family RNA polymerase sigma factor [Carboxylicivirga sp.]|jgi:RNA polymerase sigma-70 factor (ECF subfamily)|nr:sigma-70 family RNA polymerase sigma factor [Carboxylicivirga sp.]
MEINAKDFIGFKSGNEKALRNIFNKLYPTLVSFAVRQAIDVMQAEDVVQDIFNKVWQRRKQFENGNKLISFLYTSVRNKTLNIKRDLKNRDRILTDKINNDEEFKDLLIEEEVNRLLYDAINSLSDRQKEVIELILQGYTVTEIAEKTQLSLNTIKTHKLRALKDLNIKLKDHLFLVTLLAAL